MRPVLLRGDGQPPHRPVDAPIPRFPLPPRKTPITMTFILQPWYLLLTILASLIDQQQQEMFSGLGFGAGRSRFREVLSN